jgi:hypothetical protein
MDDLPFSLRRGGGTPRSGPAGELATRFRNLIQSPLRAGILRHLSARADEMYEVESLMQTFGSLRLDVENCVRELVDFGVAQAAFGTPMLYAGLRPHTSHLPISWTDFSNGAPRRAPRIGRHRSSGFAR